MKKTRFLLMTLVIMASVSVSTAQTLITSTQASTTVILPKSGRVRGLVLRPEVGAGSHFDLINRFTFSLNATLAYQFNPRFAIGGGLGVDYDDYYDWYRSWFANLRWYFSDTYWSPYIDLKAGVAKDSYTYFMASAMLGLQCKRFDFGFSTYYPSLRWTLNFAYNIQFGKKSK